jgi:rod shape-determining protein MreC
MSTQTGSGLGRRRSTARRVIIAALVVICVATFSLYFRESGDSGPLHSFQSGVGSVVAPVQRGATSAVRPLRDLWGWSTSLIDARDRAASLERENARLQGVAAAAQIDKEEMRQLRLLAGVGEDYRADYDLLPAPIISNSTTPSWYARAGVYVGSDDGVVINSPVLAGVKGGEALVGKVTSVEANSSDVTWITESRFSVGVTIPDAGSAKGILQASSLPGQLVATDVRREAPVKEGQVVATGGFAQTRPLSIFPANIPVGLVSSPGVGDSGTERTVQVKPFVDPRGIKYVVVLAPKSALAKRRASGN